MMFIKRLFVIAMPVLLLAACAARPDKKESAKAFKAEMIAAEISFSELSEAKGMRHALMEYIDSNGVLLRPNTLPLVGGDAINFLSQANDSSYTMVWQPKGGNVATSGDLGYTYGVYTVTEKTNQEVISGTYVNIWKKQVDGSWKLLLDSGNEGTE